LELRVGQGSAIQWGDGGHHEGKEVPFGGKTWLRAERIRLQGGPGVVRIDLILLLINVLSIVNFARYGMTSLVPSGDRLVGADANLTRVADFD